MASLSQSTINPETSKPTIQNLVDSLTKSENLLKDAKMLDSLKKLIAGLKDIELQFLMKSGHNTVDVGVRVQTVLDRIHVLSNNLGPYDDQEFALQAVSLQEKFDTLTKIVSKLKSQVSSQHKTSFTFSYACQSLLKGSKRVWSHTHTLFSGCI